MIFVKMYFLIANTNKLVNLPLKIVFTSFEPKMEFPDFKYMVQIVQLLNQS